jgi:hypothetical protein
VLIMKTRSIVINYDALIIIDMQAALVKTEPYNRSVVVANIKNYCMLVGKEKFMSFIFNMTAVLVMSWNME